MDDIRKLAEAVTDEMLDDLEEVADWLFDQISGHTEYIGRKWLANIKQRRQIEPSFTAAVKLLRLHSRLCGRDLHRAALKRK